MLAVVAARRWRAIDAGVVIRATAFDDAAGCWLRAVHSVHRHLTDRLTHVGHDYTCKMILLIEVTVSPDGSQQSIPGISLLVYSKILLRHALRLDGILPSSERVCEDLLPFHQCLNSSTIRVINVDQFYEVCFIFCYQFDGNLLWNQVMALPWLDSFLNCHKLYSK